MNYLDLLELAAPEAVVIATALLVLVLGLASKRSLGVCTAVAAAGIFVAIAAVLLLPDRAKLLHGMLVVSPLNSLFKIICLVLALFTVVLAPLDDIPRHRAETVALLFMSITGVLLFVGRWE